MGQGTAWLWSSLLPAYYYGTWACRRIGGSLAMWQGRYPIAILFYHRVADHTPTAWTISNREFARQIRWMSRHFQLISLNEAQRRINGGRNSQPAVCITFDDGYAENCDQALPLLLARRIPFTYFVASDYVLGNKPFPHDAARGQPLPPNTVMQLRTLASHGVEIGAHTRTHADLGPMVDRESLWREIVGLRDDLQQSLGQAVRYFAFPYGQYANLRADAFQVARAGGLAGVCSAYGGYNFPGEDAFHLQRIHADPNFLRFRNWLAFEPRIAVGVRRFEYELAEATSATRLPPQA